MKFFPILQTIWTVGKFLPNRSEAEKLAGSDKKKNIFAYQPRSKGTFLLYTEKISLNRVITM